MEKKQDPINPEPNDEGLDALGDPDEYQELPEIFQKDPLPPEEKEKGNLPALIFGAAGLLCLLCALFLYLL